MKKSKQQRKYLNQMRTMGDVPWPARRFKYPPTDAHVLTSKRCSHVVATRNRPRRGWRGIIDRVLRRKPVTEHGLCNTLLVLIPASRCRRRRIICPSCSRRTREMRRALEQMFGKPSKRARHA